MVPAPREADEDSAKVSDVPTLGEMWKPAGKHDSVRELLIRLGLKKYTKMFRKHEILSVALLRSMTAMGTLKANLKELRMADEDIRVLSAAVLSSSAITLDAATGTGEVVLAGGDTYCDDETDDEPDPMALPEKPADTKTKIHLTKEEYDEILRWSDDEDMDTPHGRFKHRQKQNYAPEHDQQFMMRDGDQGAIVDVSKGPRNILKKLLRASTGWQNPVEGFEIDVCYTARYCPTVDGPFGPTCGALADVFDERYAKKPLHCTIGSPELFPPLSSGVRATDSAARVASHGASAGSPPVLPLPLASSRASRQLARRRPRVPPLRRGALH